MSVPGFRSLDLPPRRIAEGLLSDHKNARTVLVESRGRRTPSLGVTWRERGYNLRDRCPSLSSTMNIAVSENKAAAALRRLEKFVEYDKKWRHLRDGQQDKLLSFDEFPWPSARPIERGTFLGMINKKSVDMFLYDPLRMHVREVENPCLTDHEKMNWETDRGMVERRVLNNVIEHDRYLVREAHAIVALYVRGANEDDETIQRHREEVERAQIYYPSAPSIKALEDFSIGVELEIERRRALAMACGLQPVSAKCPDLAQTPREVLSAAECAIHAAFPRRRRFLTKNDGLDDLELLRSRAPKQSTQDTHIKRTDSRDSLFSQAGPIIFGSSQPVPVQHENMDEDVPVCEESDQGTTQPPVESHVPTQPVAMDEDADNEKDLFLLNSDDLASEMGSTGAPRFL